MSSEDKRAPEEEIEGMEEMEEGDGPRGLSDSGGGAPPGRGGRPRRGKGQPPGRQKAEQAPAAGSGARYMRDAPLPEVYSSAERATGIILFIIFTLLILSAFLVGAGRDLFRTYVDFFVIFQDGHGLLPGVKVRFKGIDVGSVTNVELMDNNKIRMDLKVLFEHKDRVKGDSLATIKSPTIIGSEYIEIQAGSAGSLPIPPGGQIPATDPRTVDQVLNAFQWEDKLKQFNQILADLGSLTNQLQDKQGPIIGTFANLNAISAQMMSSQGTFGSFIVKDDLYQEILAAARDVRLTAESLSQTAGGLKRDVPRLSQNAGTILKQVETGTKSFPEISRTARESLRDVDQVLDSAKRNFLIRMNLSPDAPPESLSQTIR